MSKWKYSKTHNFRRFQPKRTSPFFSAHFLRNTAPVKLLFRHFFDYDMFYIRIIKNYIKLMCLRAWEYARTIFRSEKLQIAYIKAELGTGKHHFWSWLCIMAMYHGYVSWLCITAMYHGYVARLFITPLYHGYVSWLCIMAMYHGYVYYITYITYYKKR